ncbi:right-handed parallel beta-helix repeat-containing protein [Coraliomargarita parva]|uniref:right-handed parallel beta-helix repeat-containing protein n=1 Tax=Coraliomargarita parva TaxID=3014050 RepID=UPI0022B5DC1E|nr:right-handed parallel beta-helix repeat-containing protein [Coraliomargarita parva]
MPPLYSLTFDNIDKEVVVAGETVTITGTGITTTSAYEVLLNDLSIVATPVDTETLEFVLPAAAVPGSLRITEDAGPEIPTLFSLEPVREITVSFSASIPVDTTGFIVGTIFGDSEDIGPSYQTWITNGEPTLVAGTAGPDNYDFLGISLNEASAMELSPRSTAKGIIFLAPSIFTFDPVVAQARLDILESLPELDAAEQAIINSLGSGPEYMEDPAVIAAMRSLLLAAAEVILVPPDPEPPAAAFNFVQKLESLVSADGFKEDLYTQALDFTVDPHQLSDSEYDHIEQLTTTKVATAFTNDSGIPHRAVKIDNNNLNFFWKGHPLDHLAMVYQLDPTSFSSLDEIQGLQGSLTEVYPRYYNNAIDRRVIPGSIKFQLYDTELTYSALKNNLGFERFEKDFLGFEREGELYVPADRPGIYMVRAFNGAIFKPQNLLAYNLPGGDNLDQAMFFENLSLAIIDSVMVIMKYRGVKKPPEGEPSKVFELGDLQGAVKPIVFEMYRKALEDRLSWSAIKQSFKITLSKVVESYFENSVKVGLENAKLDAVSNVFDKGTAVIDLITEDAPSALARLMWVFNAPDLLGIGPVTKSIESSIFVIGDPFGPKITRLSKLYGHRGAELVILGRNFTDNPANIIVRFGPVPANPEDPNVGGPIANIISSSWSYIALEVPELPDPLGPEIVTEISVTVLGTGSDSSGNLPDGRNLFSVLPDPVIDSLNPSTPIADGLMLVNGQNFSPDYSRNKVLYDYGELDVLSGTADTLLVRVPNTNVTLNLRVEVDGKQSEPFEFTPTAPSPESGGGDGWIISVSTTAMGNTRDGDITLEEAMMLARGELAGTNITTRPEGNLDPPGTYESDHLIDSVGTPGIASADMIVLPTSLDGQVIYVNTVLPAVASYDTIRRADGATVLIHGDPGASDGIVVANAVDATVQSLDLEGFSGSGIRITGTCSRIVVEDIALSDCGTGLLVEGTASELFMKEMTVSNSSSHGIHFNGAGANSITSCQLDYFIIDEAAGHGIYLAGNVSHCQISMFDITTSGMDGIRLSGPGVLNNSFDRSAASSPEYGLGFLDASLIGVSGSEGYGIHVDGGASNNQLDAGHLNENMLGGILVTDATSTGNRFGSTSSVFAAFGHSRISLNEGPGITVRSPNTVLRNYNIFGNRPETIEVNHGIWLDGPNATGIEVEGMRIGYDDSVAPTNFDNQNDGSGIAITGGANDILIGTINNHPGGKERNFIAGNRDHGIYIEGADTSDIVINHTDIGRADSDLSIAFDLYNRPAGLVPFSNGLNGIRIENGATGIEIGSEETVRDVHIVNHDSSAGVYINGPDAGQVRIIGTHFGTSYFGDDEGNLVGIHLANGTQGNIIGMRGEPIEDGSTTQKYFHNTFAAHTQAAILIEDSGGTYAGVITEEPPETPPEGANVIINNYFGWPWEIENWNDLPPPNEVDILITGNSFANRIGGIHWTESNYFNNSNRACIELDGVTPPAKWMSNRIIGNVGWDMGTMLPAPPSDILAVTQPVGAGILLTNGSSGNIIGGMGEGETNWFQYGLVGVWVEGLLGPGATDNHIIQCYLKYNSWAGTLSRYAHGNTYGPWLELLFNGTTANGLGGIVLDNSDDNKIIGNWVGTEREMLSYRNGENRNNGIYLIDSAGNQIGGFDRQRNVIVDSKQNGILIEGGGSTGNKVLNNAIGYFPESGIFKTNEVAGIGLSGGANHNQIGGILEGVNGLGEAWRKELPNGIRGNAIGIKTEDAGTTENQFRRNSITKNSGAGILDLSGNAADVPPPTILEAGEDRVSGTVDATKIPDGSIVEIFSDSGDEGGEYIGSTIVRDGAFSIRPVAILGQNVNATVTHGLTGVTSEFSTLGVPGILQTVTLSNYNNLPPTNRDEANTGRILIGKFQFLSSGRDASIDRVVFSFNGTADKATMADSYQVLQDADNNGVLSVGDIILEDNIVMGASATYLFAYPRLKLPAGQATTLLLAANMNGSATATQTVIMSIDFATRVDTVGLPVPFEIAEEGTFPVTADTVTLYDGGAPDMGFVIYLGTLFPGETDPNIIGADKDPDGDGRSNLREYAEGTDASVPDSPLPVTLEVVGETLYFSFIERRDAPDLLRDVLFSRQLTEWARENSRILSLEITQLDAERNQVDVAIDISDIILGKFFVLLNYEQAP